jgi:hypothetical protein
MPENVYFAEERTLTLAGLTLAARSLQVMMLFWDVARRKRASHTIAWNIGPKNRRYVFEHVRLLPAFSPHCTQNERTRHS